MYSIEFRWQNFRPFIDTDWVAVKPITILIGPNNSGKSSLLAPLLILKQTLRSGRARSPLVLRDELINAGSFKDIVNSHDPTKRVTFSFRFRERASAEEMPELGEDSPSECSLTFKAERSPGVVSLQNYTVADSYGRTLLSRTRTASNRYTLSAIRDWVLAEDDEDIASTPSNQAAEKAIQTASPARFLFNSRNVLSAAVRAVTSSEESDADEDHDEEEPWMRQGARPLRLSSFAVAYSAAVEIVEHYMREHVLDLVYLGPLRENPQRLYDVSGDTPRDVGVRGEFTPELLLRNEKKPLFNRINRWLQEFGLNGSIVCSRVTETAFALELEAGGTRTNFADVGFGFSQLLPLIVQGLQAEEGSLLIAEQPEIHLNPRLQAKLAELFVEIRKRDVSVLVETHSEHLLLAIRRLVAEGSLRADDVAIYFVESTDQGSQVKSVPLQENGHIEASDWPNNFFGETLRESLKLASAQSRRSSAG